jgi:hypothetical protein
MKVRTQAWQMFVTGFGCVLLCLGFLFILLPEVGAELFGIDTTGERAYVRALGLRDLALGAGLFLVSRISVPAVRVLLGVSVVIPLGDLLLVLHEAGLSAPLSLALHGCSGLALGVLAATPSRN